MYVTHFAHVEPPMRGRKPIRFYVRARTDAGLWVYLEDASPESQISNSEIEAMVGSGELCRVLVPIPFVPDYVVWLDFEGSVILAPERHSPEDSFQQLGVISSEDRLQLLKTLQPYIKRAAIEATQAMLEPAKEEIQGLQESYEEMKLELDKLRSDSDDEKRGVSFDVTAWGDGDKNDDN